MKDIYSYKDFAVSSPLVFKDIDGRKGIVTGYFANFNSLDSDGDVIKPGAFSRTINATGPQSAKPRIKHLMNHDISQPLGVLLTLKEDEAGLYYESKLGTHALGMDFIKMAESGLITEHSIGYQTKKFNQVTSWEDYKEGDIRRELTEVKLWEGSSLTAWGANQNTPLTGLKNEIEINKLINKAEAIEKFCRDTKATDEIIEMLLLYNKQLLQSITDLKSTQPSNDIAPEEEVIDEKADTVIKTTLPDVVECPACTRLTHNTQGEKGYIKCHRCDAQFVYGSKLFIKI
jgi:HK97 family phage prohead protease